MTKSLPLFSVITTVKNDTANITKCINNVYNQIYPNIEHIIVDSNSTDGTLEKIKANQDKISKFISEPDNGLYEGMNKGIQLASGKWIHILNVDDRYITPNSIKGIITKLKENHTNYCDMQLEREDHSLYEQRFLFKRWKLYLSAFLPHPSLIVSKKQYNQIGLYKTNYKVASDHEFIMRLLKHYKPNHIQTLFTTMKRGGLSEKNFKISIDEFKEISINYGCPRIIANLIARYKNYKWSKVL